jgi:hypothetical protein
MAKSIKNEHAQHRPLKGKQRWCHIRLLRHIILYTWKKFDISFYIVNCLEKWHTCVLLSQKPTRQHYVCSDEIRTYVNAEQDTL